ncbi:MAG: metallophosphoesterase, partial [Ignavibacteriae bacterium]|nr:metallophosphoesterase [Ignavibacteriota bacterium]
MKSIKIAIVSDLHCHPSDLVIEGKKIDDTYLKTDLLRSPNKDHPVESLLKLIKAEDLECDLTLCPGDFTNKSNVQGLISGWDFCLEIGNALKSSDVIGTLGNHDVDSFLNYSEYSLTNVKGVKKGFPFKDSSNGILDKFWSLGCGIIEKEDIRIIVVNSCHFHHNKFKSGSGEVSDELIEYVDEYLSEVKDDKICLLLTHHHPIDHSMLKLGEEDKILNSDKLLEILGKYRVDLIIHGHKHHALLRYHQCLENNHKIPIFSSGSFSATSNIIFTQQRNHFHMIEISKNGTKNAKGKLKTWTYFPMQGWILNHDNKGFDAYCGFGSEKKVDNIATEIENIIDVGENRK